MTHKIIRLPEVKAKTGLSTSSVYLQISKGIFPKAISLGDRAVGWLEADIEQWLVERIAVSKGADND